jgi:hypothetical protein
VYLLGIRVPFFVRSRDCSLTQKAEAPPGTRGRFGGIPFKEDPNVSRPLGAADQGRRCRQREQERNQRKRNGPLAAECLRKRGDLLRQNGTYLPAAAGKSMPMPPCVAGDIKAENLP